jgi:nucleoside-diphosphate-sugar epimerase
MRIAVTGAAGFVGGAVVAAARERGWQVHALTRREWDVAAGPLADPPDVDAVVHAAAAVTDHGDPGPIWRANLLGTRNVVATFPGVRLVHISSASVYDPFVPTVMATEDAAPVRRYLTTYGASKAAAERLLTGRPDTVVLRPHAVYGPGDTTLLPRVLGAVRGRTLWLPGGGRSRHTLTAIGTLAAAALLGCTGPPGIYNVGDAEPVVLADVLDELLAERGIRARIRSVPPAAAWGAAAVAEAVAGPTRPLRLSRYAISHLGYERTLDLRAARAGLRLQPAPTSVRGAASW